MNFFDKSKQFWTWYYATLLVLFKRRPVETFWITIFLCLALVTNFLALVLPLKVILLAGSKGVPEYLHFLMTQENKKYWIVGLILASISLYMLTLILESGVGKVSAKVSRSIVHETSNVIKGGNYAELLNSYYQLFCKNFANLLFFLASFCTIALISPFLSSTLILVFICQFLFVCWVVRGDEHHVTRLKGYVLNKPKDLINIFQTINFVCGFIFLVAPYLFNKEGNLLVTLVSFLLVRQSVRALTTIINTSINLSTKQQNINNIIIKNNQSIQPNYAGIENIKTFFSMEKRDLLLNQTIGTGSTIKSTWQDPQIPNVTCFLVEEIDEKTISNRYQLQVYPKKLSYHLDNEEKLFKHINRKSLLAPSLISRFSYADYECQLCDYGTSVFLGASFKKREASILQDLWSSEVPVNLATSYLYTHRLIHNRLDEKLLSHLELALEDKELRILYENFLRALPNIKNAMEEVPLYVHNLNFNEKNIVFVDENHQALQIMNWSRWSLEPIGYYLPNLKSGGLQALLEVSAERRKSIDLSGNLLDKVLLANTLSKIENEILEMRYRNALRYIKKSEISTHILELV